MKSWISTLVTLGILFYVGRMIVYYTLGRDLLQNAHVCHTELHVGERIKRSLDTHEIDALFDQYKTCMQDKGNAIDRLIGYRKVADDMVEAMREDRKTKGPR